MDTLFPIIAIVVGLIVLVGATLWNKQKNNKQSSHSKNNISRGDNVHDLINVRDIRGNFLYTNDNKICAYFRVNPISIDLYSPCEKKSLCQLLTSQLASEQRPFKFLAVSRPVDISPLISDYSRIYSTSDNSVVRDILSNEMTVMMNYAHSGEVVQRQFYFMIWEEWKSGIESDLLKRINDFRSKFITCRLTGDVLKQHEIVRLCNLVNNPAYSAVEDMDFEANIPTIMHLYGNRNESDNELKEVV